MRSTWPRASRPLLALVVVAVALAGTVATGGARTAQEEYEAELYDRHQAARAEHGLPSLAYDAALTSVARDWAEELARSRQLRHNPDVAAQVDRWVTDDWSRLGENVGYSGSIASLFDAYMASPTHRDNILGDFNRIGVAVVRGDDGLLWACVLFLQGPPL